ncbi:MAG: hypothetical protein A3F67_09735 [Verrucomicrobia bacterium RIFCSPHIGHO2_12_FULL_41_10]|nr:MAG: hypothetical protein A3F67_09735 [Verrucomicrobia bacterium RIFCSPHIGHO2_12_FULL_41_10]HLB33033.1 NAD-dependent epimerase/dehydratase family protein [Chthoniobacterales bacterium]
MKQNPYFTSVAAQRGLNGLIAITGGRGRLAHQTASFLRSLGYKVVLFSRTGGEGFQQLDDLCNPLVIELFDAIIHFAWSTVPLTSETDPGREEREDLPLLKKLLESLIVSNNSPKFIFLSSASVYGNTGEESVTEAASCHPLSGYARGKFQAEEIITQVLEQYPHLQTIILRVTNVIGFPSDPDRPQGILPRIINSAQNQQSLEIWGDGCCSKDYLWIDDFLTALQASLTIPLQGVFNLGSGENFSVLDLVSMVEKSLNISVAVTHRSRYAWDVSRSFINSTAFSQATGWKPERNISKKIKDLCKDTLQPL